MSNIKYKNDQERREARKAVYKRYYERNRNNPEYIAKRKGWIKNRAEKVRIQTAMRKYNITEEYYHELMKKPCEACGTKEKVVNVYWVDGKKKERTLNHAIDHNHDTGQVRGVLCGHCNNSLGRLKDNPDTILGLFAYLVDKDNSIEYNNKIKRIMEVINE